MREAIPAGSQRTRANAFFDPLDRHHFHAGDRLPRPVRFGDQRVREAELRRFAQPLLPALHRAHLAGEADFAEHDQLRRQRLVLERRHDRHQHREVRGGLGDAHAAHRVDEHVLVEARDARVAVQHREQQREAVLLEARP